MMPAVPLDTAGTNIDLFEQFRIREIAIAIGVECDHAGNVRRVNPFGMIVKNERQRSECTR